MLPTPPLAFPPLLPAPQFPAWQNLSPCTLLRRGVALALRFMNPSSSLIVVLNGLPWCCVNHAAIVFLRFMTAHNDCPRMSYTFFVPQPCLFS